MFDYWFHHLCDMITKKVSLIYKAKWARKLGNVKHRHVNYSLFYVFWSFSWISLLASLLSHQTDHHIIIVIKWKTNFPYIFILIHYSSNSNNLQQFLNLLREITRTFNLTMFQRLKRFHFLCEINIKIGVWVGFFFLVMLTRHSDFPFWHNYTNSVCFD